MFSPTSVSTASRTRLVRLQYVPLVILVIVGLVASVIGVLVRGRLEEGTVAREARALVLASPAPITRTASTPAVLPTVCHPPVEQPMQQPWLNGPSARTEAVWASNHGPTANDPVVMGEDGWAFWNDAQALNFSQAVGRRVLSKAEVAQWHDYLAALRDSLSNESIPFYIVVTPAKWDVYPQHLPTWSKPIRGSGPLDQLLAASPDLPLIDLRAPLREASQTVPVFSRLNSHWTNYGAYLGWNTIAACISETAPELGTFSALALDGVRTSSDNNEFAPYGITNGIPDWTDPEYSEPLSPVEITTADGAVATVEGIALTDLSILPVTTATAVAQVNKTALVIRDSFGGGLSVPLQQAFARTVQVRHNFDYAPDQRPDVSKLVTENRPDVVILQIAERHLTFAPVP